MDRDKLVRVGAINPYEIIDWSFGEIMCRPGFSNAKYTPLVECEILQIINFKKF